ncbi:2-oxoglutarate and iron-dependent oxygenase domain-containing protein 3 [Nymphon striatum]|nr:2-oxoglutarate and iron-dependent oxygenase domain-containing protein 3 [Nymphon striatum]
MNNGVPQAQGSVIGPLGLAELLLIYLFLTSLAHLTNVLLHWDLPPYSLFEYDLYSDDGGKTATPVPSITRKKILSRILFAGFIMFLVYLNSKLKDSKTFAEQSELINQRNQEISCSQKDVSQMKFEGCSPMKCGRIVSDNLVTSTEVENLLRIAKKGLALGRSNGGASILDLHSGALSRGENFVNIYKLKSGKSIFSSEDLKVYSAVKNKIKQKIAEEFNLVPSHLYLTHPTFFSEITSKEAKSSHDEYWHIHVDKEQYKLFHYTSLLYLNDYNINFQGGRFVFVGHTNYTVEPRAGRVSIFTSGHENPHYVEKVTSGTRYAITIPFTCDKRYAISDP